MYRTGLAILIAAGGPAESRGQVAWEMVAESSTVSFRVRTLLLHTVSGRFTEYAARVTTAGSSWEGGLADVTVRAASVDTRNPERDRSIRGAELLDVDAYPEIRFVGTAERVSPPDDRLRLRGALTVRGVQRPFDLWIASPPLPAGDTVRVRAAGTLNRWDYGIRFAKTDLMAALQRAVPIVGDSVSIEVNVLLVRARSQPPPPRAAIPAAAHELVASLSPEERGRLMLPFTASERLVWRRSPAPRPGLRLRDLSDAHREKVHRILRLALTPEGYATVDAILRNEDRLGQSEDGLGATYTWVALYGAIGAATGWGFRFGGHHVSIHLTLRGSDMVSSTPLLLGGEPTRLVEPRLSLARRLVQSFTAEQRGQGVWERAAPDSLDLDERRPLLLGEPTGLADSLLTADQQRLLRDLIASYTDVARGGMDAVARPGAVHFLWVGPPAGAGGAVAYRIAGPGFAIDYFDAGDHAHTLIRTATDFGRSVPQKRP